MFVSPDDASFDSVVEVNTGVRWIYDLISSCASSTDSLVSGSCTDDIVLFFLLFFCHFFSTFFPLFPSSSLRLFRLSDFLSFSFSLIYHRWALSPLSFKGMI